MTVLDPAPTRHQKALDQGMSTFKRYANSTLDEWHPMGEKDGVRLCYQKPDIPHAPTIYRGDYHYAADPMMIEHTLPLDLSSALVCKSIRAMLEPRVGFQEIRVIRNRFSLMTYAQSHPFWPVSPRDYSQVNQREFDDQTLYLVSVSVIDDEICPPLPGFTRAHIIFSGMKVARDKTDGGWTFTAVGQIDLGGSIPTIISHRALYQLPTVTRRLADYFDRYGFPPTGMVDGVEFLGEDFDHNTTVYTLHLGGSPGGQADITCCARMFPEGFDVEIQGQGQYDVDVVTKKPHKVILLTQLMGSVTVLVKGKVQHGLVNTKKKSKK